MSFLCLVIVRRSPQLAAVLVLTTVWLDLVITVLNAGTFIEGSMATFPLLVFGAGLLLGSPGAIVAAAASVTGVTAAGFLGGATLSRLGLDHGREGFFLFAMICCCVGTAVMTRAALLSYSRVLSRSERERIRYLGLFEELPDGILSLNDQGQIVESNDAAARMLCRDGGPLVGRVFAEVVAGFGLTAAIDLKHAIVPRQTIELTVPGPDDVPFTLELTFRTVQVPDAPILVLLRDVTHRKLIEQHLGHAQRLEAVGQLAGGIAHDFNNLLTAIGGSAEMITLSGDEESRESAQVILSAQRRGTNLTRQLLAFARRDKHQSGNIDLAKTVAGMSKLAGRLLGSQHRLRITQSSAIMV